jgi:hypothetical protein
MKNNSKSNIKVKAEGSKKGANKMMKYDAIGSMWLKILGGLALLITSIRLPEIILALKGLI